MDPFDLTGRVAIVTGGNRGIGFGIARGLGARGARIAVLNRDSASGESAVEQLRQSGIDADHWVLDLAGSASVASVLEAVQERWGRLDILVNNAASREDATAFDHSIEAFDEIMRVNVTSIFALSQAFARLAIAHQHTASIINISSIVADRGMFRRSSYVTSKGAINSLCRALAMEWAPHGIRVNNIAPGMVEVPERSQQQRANAVRWGMTMGQIPMGRPATPTDLVGAAVFLASDAAGYVTGHTLCVDGGWSLTAVPMSAENA